MRTLGAVCGLLAFVLLDAAAQRTTPMSLRDMVDKAGTIVQGTVSGTRSGKDPVTGMICTWVTVDVREDLYGAPARQFTFKTLGGEADGLVYRPADIPRFAPGEEMIVLLYPAHRETGMQSPVGLGQGKFVLQTSRSGKRVAEQVAPTPALRMSSPRLAGTAEISADLLAAELRTLVRDVKHGGRP